MTTVTNSPGTNPTPDATITWISGPVLRARTVNGFRINEAVLVGDRRLLGEVIRIDGDNAMVQVYEDTTGLRPGDPLTATGSPLSVRLGPGLLGNIFDGLLNPLSTQADWIKPGITQDQQAQSFPFVPRVSTGQRLSAGSAFGAVQRKDARPQHCLLPPGYEGEVIRIAEAGNYTERDTVCVLRDAEGNEYNLAMSHRWPVRKPRPVEKRIPVEGPLFTGQRILDSVFPLSCGGRAAMPGGFGTGENGTAGDTGQMV